MNQKVSETAKELERLTSSLVCLSHLDCRVSLLGVNILIFLCLLGWGQGLCDPLPQIVIRLDVVQVMDQNDSCNTQ